MIEPPRGLLIDYGGTLVEEVAFDPRPGIELLLTHAVDRPAGVSVDQIVDRAYRITREVAERRDQFQIETSWASLTRLIYDVFGIGFDAPLDDLELPFWIAAAVTRPMPGVADALRALHRAGLPMGVVSNSSFRQHVIRHDLAKHGIAEYLSAIVVSVEYAVRKPNPLLFEVGAARLGLSCKDIWFVGDRLDTDVSGATAAGMTAIWFGAPTGTQHSEAAVTAPTWSDLVAMFHDARCW